VRAGPRFAIKRVKTRKARVFLRSTKQQLGAFRRRFLRPRTQAGIMNFPDVFNFCPAARALNYSLRQHTLCAYELGAYLIFIAAYFNKRLARLAAASARLRPSPAGTGHRLMTKCHACRWLSKLQPIPHQQEFAFTECKTPRSRDARNGNLFVVCAHAADAPLVKLLEPIEFHPIKTQQETLCYQF